MIPVICVAQVSAAVSALYSCIWASSTCYRFYLTSWKLPTPTFPTVHQVSSYFLSPLRLQPLTLVQTPHSRLLPTSPHIPSFPTASPPLSRIFERTLQTLFLLTIFWLPMRRRLKTSPYCLWMLGTMMLPRLRLCGWALNTQMLSRWRSPLQPQILMKWSYWQTEMEFSGAVMRQRRPERVRQRLQCNLGDRVESYLQVSCVSIE